MSVRRRQHVSASTYVDGNTVRKVQRTVEIRPERDEREEYRHKHAVRRNQEKALYMNGPYVLARMMHFRPGLTRMWIWIMYIKWRPKSSAWYMQIRIRFFYMTRRKASM